MALSIHCVWCERPLLDVEHAKKHVAEQCEKAPWREKQALLENENLLLKTQLDEARAQLRKLEGRA